MNSSETSEPDSIGQMMAEDSKQLRKTLDDLGDSDQLDRLLEDMAKEESGLDQLVAELNEIPIVDQLLGRAEFPMLAKQLLDAIKNSGESIHAIANAADIQQASLQRFVSGERDIRLDTASRLADYFGMHLTRPRAKPKG